ncbi:cytochrome d ubiquinol oxidase subunit II [Roseobacteraceae bacterium S113]
MSTYFADPNLWLPLVFAGLMGFSILVYVILDGFDLGIGMLAPFAEPHQKDRMIASIGPFWDANETWLVMAIGLLLVAFPSAHGAILTALYLPVAIMLVGLILRGVAFEFRVKAPAPNKPLWNFAFFAGSLMTSLSQGFMLGLYIMGLEYTWGAVAFAMLVAVCTAAGYCFIGACWLIIKTEDTLQKRAVTWAKWGLGGVMAGFPAISLATPLISDRIFEKWFSIPEMFLLAPLPIAAGIVTFGLMWALRRLPDGADRYRHIPFAAAAALFSLAFLGLAYSFYPYVVPDQITIYEAASAPESLKIILWGVVIVMPMIAAYTALAYIVFRGKARDLTYY